MVSCNNFQEHREANARLKQLGEIRKLRRQIAANMAYWHQVAKNESSQDTPDRWRQRADSLFLLLDEYGVKIETGELTDKEIDARVASLTEAEGITVEQAIAKAARAKFKSIGEIVKGE